jgi:hypothetical protein
MAFPSNAAIAQYYIAAAKWRGNGGLTLKKNALTKRALSY